MNQRKRGAGEQAARRLIGAGLRFAGKKALVALGAWLGLPVLAVILGGFLLMGFFGLMLAGFRSDPGVADVREAFMAAAEQAQPRTISADGSEAAYRVPWGLLLMVWEMAGEEPAADRAAPQLARELAPQVTYRTSVVIREWTDEQGEYHREEQQVKLVSQVVTYRGIYRHRYHQVVEASGGETVTREVSSGVDHEPGYGLLVEVLSRWAPGWRASEEELENFIAVAEAVTWGVSAELHAEGDDAALSGALGSDLPVQFAGDPGDRVWPADGPITSPFGMRFHPVYQRWRMHTGIDIGLPVGAPVRTAWGGRVAFAGWAGELGLAVAIDHGTGEFTVYGHLSRVDVVVGQEVASGQVVGGAGATGVATGPHLHFAVWREGKPMDPVAWLPAR